MGQMCTIGFLVNSHKSCDPRDEAPEAEERLLVELNKASTKSGSIMANMSKDDSYPGRTNPKRSSSLGIMVCRVWAIEKENSGLVVEIVLHEIVL